MNLIQKAAIRIARAAGLTNSQIFVSSGQWFWPDDNSDVYISNGYNDLPNVYGIISLIIQKTSIVPFEVFKVKNETEARKYRTKIKMARSAKDFAEAMVLKNRAMEKVEGSDLEMILNRPNDYQSTEEVFEQLDGYKLLTGNAYLHAWTPGVGNEPDAVTSLHVTPSTMVSVITGDMSNPVKAYKFNFLTDPIESENVAHFKTWKPLISGNNPFDGIYGMSPLMSCRRLLEKYKVADVVQGSMFYNMTPAGVLSADSNGIKGMTEAQAVALRDSYKQKTRNHSSRGDLLITSASVKWNQIGFSPVDLNIIEAKKEILGELCNVYKVPIALFSENNSTDNNLTESRKMMITDAVIPVVESRKNVLNRWLVPKFDDSLIIEFDYSVFSEIAEEIHKLAETQSRMWWTTGNEKRLATNYDELKDPNMDKILVPSNLIPLEDLNIDVGIIDEDPFIPVNEDETED